MYNKNIVYGLGFDTRGEINVVSRCTYDNGNIVKYEYCDCGLQEYANLYYEEYFYENNVLSKTTVFDVIPKIDFYTEDKYEIELNESGKIVKLIGGPITNGAWEKSVYNFNKYAT